MLTARVLDIPVGYVLFSAIAAGVCGAIVLLVATHWAGMVVALLVFAASNATYDPDAVEEDADSFHGCEVAPTRNRTRARVKVSRANHYTTGRRRILGSPCAIICASPRSSIGRASAF